MAQNGNVIKSAIEMDAIASHPKEAAIRTGDNHQPTTENHQGDEIAAHTTLSAPPVVQGQQENLPYSEDLGFLPMRKDPRDMFDIHPKSHKFDIKNKDVLHAIKEV